MVLRFAVAADGHWGLNNSELNWPQMISWLHAEKEDKGLDFVIFNGDNAHNNPLLLYDVKNTLQTLTIPYYMVCGNHDRASNAEWEAIWGYPKDHDFVVSDYSFILANTSNENGDYSPPDIDFLQEKISQHENQKGIFIFMHISQYSSSWDFGIETPEVIELFENCHNLICVVHSHDHNNDKVLQPNRIPYAFTGHFDSWGVPYFGYRIFEIDESGLIYTYQYDAENQQIINSNILHTPIKKIVSGYIKNNGVWKPIIDGKVKDTNWRQGILAEIVH